ncbi:MAG: copper chaperone PCu(A)C, partial [Phenylobacterium sp.]
MKLISALTLALAVASSAQAATPLTVSGAWSRPAVVGTTGVGYLVVANGGKAADTLVRVESPVAARVEMHSSSMAGGRRPGELARGGCRGPVPEQLLHPPIMIERGELAAEAGEQAGLVGGVERPSRPGRERGGAGLDGAAHGAERLGLTGAADDGERGTA